MVAMAAGPSGLLSLAFGLRLLLAAVLQTVSAFGAEFSSEACRELGFSSNLLCSSVIFLDSLTCFSSILTVEDAVRKKHNLKQKSFMQVLSLKFVDENWGGSLKSKLLSGVINPNYSEDYKSSMFVVQILY